jgi:hypothetical protein
MFMSEEDIIEALAEKSMPIEEVAEIYYANKENLKIVGQVAMNLSQKTSVYNHEIGKSDLMVELLIDLSNSSDMGSRWAVAKNPHTPVEILEKLGDDEVNLVRALVGSNPHTPAKTLEKFFSDEKIVRDSLSGNPNTPLKLLKILADDKDKMVRLRLAENPSAPDETLQRLLSDSDENVRKASEVHLEKRREA